MVSRLWTELLFLTAARTKVSIAYRLGQLELSDAVARYAALLEESERVREGLRVQLVGHRLRPLVRPAWFIAAVGSG